MNLIKNSYPYIPCPCKSGKKYKFCCKNSTSNIDEPFRHSLGSFTIKTEPLTPDDRKCEWVTLNPKDKELLNEIFFEFKLHPERINSENHQIFHQLKMLREKYPESPLVLNHLCSLYSHLDDVDKVVELIIESYEKFPSYLFSKIAMGNLFVINGEYDKFLGVFNGAFSLKQLYPNREVFHIDEFKGVQGAFFQYYCEIGDLERAKNYFKVLEKVMVQLGREEDSDFLTYKSRFLNFHS